MSEHWQKNKGAFTIRTDGLGGEREHKDTLDEETKERGRRRLACELIKTEREEEEKEVWDEDLPVFLRHQAD